MIQTPYKNNTGIVQKQYRKVITVEKKEIRAWKNLFSLFGHKAECSRAIGVPTDTIQRILKNEKGLERIVVAIRQYCGDAKK